MTVRLRPLFVAVFLWNVSLWVPIEKLFETEIGFDAASIGVLAAGYAAVVPLLEVPSGVLADRWSRRSVLVLAVVALALSALIGGLSTNVATYTASALLLGVFFALQSGTTESMVYDTLLEETGGSEAFERTIGTVRVTESIALVSSALVGGAIAEVAPLRVTYFLTVPFLAGAIAALLVFREPRLHEASESQSLSQQILATYRTITGRGRLRPIVTLAVLAALLLQAMLEFGPVWLVALAAPAIVYGPHWAGLMSALGLGGLLGGRLGFSRVAPVAVVGAAMVTCSLVLALIHVTIAVIAAQVVLTLLVVAVSIPITRRLHDAVPSGIRAGVASGVGTLTWLTFLPFAVVFGVVSNNAGVDTAAWLVVVIAAVTALLMLTFVRVHEVEPATELVAVTTVEATAAVTVPAFPPDRFLPPDDPQWPGHWAYPPSAWEDFVPSDLLNSDATLDDVRAAISDLPELHRRVVVLRDIDGRTTEEISESLDLSPDEIRLALHAARLHVRTRLECLFSEHGHG
jgi:DNA-directed RNA polymerase specialized sigma24 family protein/predicted MFS family arabinose efflux permease